MRWRIEFDLSGLPSMLHETAERVILYTGSPERFPPRGCHLTGRIVSVEADRRQRINLMRWAREHGFKDLVTAKKL